MDIISIIVPTLNRPAALQRALQSLARQVQPADAQLEIVVVDNSTDRNARPLVETLNSAKNIHYVHEPVMGIASARNRGIAAAAGNWIAFLDDDEEAGEKWLVSLFQIANKTGADVVFGPVEAKSESAGGDLALMSYFSRAIDREDGADITGLVAHLGTNNSMFHKSRCMSGNQTFDVDLNATGGEDSLLLKGLAQNGRRFAWSSDARVTEWVPPRRMTWNYVRQRKFLSGQIRVIVLHKLQPANWGRIGFWMMVGLAQSIAGMSGMILLRPFNRARSERAAVISCAGLGKLFWTPRFRAKLYGSGLVS